ncbi:hypothetical protein GTA09_02315 [Rhodococcus hoagii]|nr:hypothetical protein [Prescottella equi]
MVVHVVRGDGIEGVSAAEMGKVRKLATSIGASLHSRGRRRTSRQRCSNFAREVNATKSSSDVRRSRWAGSSTRG